MAGSLFADIPDESVRAVLIRNFKNLQHITGMRISNDGFFLITNRVVGGTEARLDSGGNWTKASDRRLKRDIEDAADLLEKLLSLNPVLFYYENQDLQEVPDKSLGFIAQDVEPVFPQLVAGTETKYLDYNGLVPVVVGAVKEMKQQYDEKIADLEAQLAELRRAVEGG